MELLAVTISNYWRDASWNRWPSYDDIGKFVTEVVRQTDRKADRKKEYIYIYVYMHMYIL